MFCLINTCLPVFMHRDWQIGHNQYIWVEWIKRRKHAGTHIFSIHFWACSYILVPEPRRGEKQSNHLMSLHRAPTVGMTLSRKGNWGIWPLNTRWEEHIQKTEEENGHCMKPPVRILQNVKGGGTKEATEPSKDVEIWPHPSSWWRLLKK